VPDLPACRHACRNLGTGSAQHQYDSPTILWLSAGSQDLAFGILRAVSVAAVQERPLPTDTILTIRCPHCMAGTDFRPMIAYKDGRFVCRHCAHTVRPGVPEYRCTCRPCLRLSRKTPLTGRGIDFSTSDSRLACAIILTNNSCAPGKVGQFPPYPDRNTISTERSRGATRIAAPTTLRSRFRLRSLDTLLPASTWIPDF
jgi:hypothetical protein